MEKLHTQNLLKTHSLKKQTLSLLLQEYYIEIQNYRRFIMLILNSVPVRLFLSFYSIAFLILLYHLRKQTELLLEHNSANWHIDCYLR